MSLHTVNGELTMEFNLSQCEYIDMASLKLMDKMVAVYCQGFLSLQYEMSVSGAMRWPDGFHKEVMIDLHKLRML